MGKSTEPRIVLWDIETTHNLAAVFRLLNMDMIPAENIVQERYLVCAAWKDAGADKVHAVSTLDDPARFKRKPNDDRHVCETLHAVLSKADVIVAHNGDAYDIKFTETRMLQHGLSPLPPIAKLDTMKTAKDRFLFNSNSLDYLGTFLGVGRKKPTTNGLWLRVLQNDRSAIREMVTYNKGDVLLLERVFNKLKPYMANFMSRELYGGSARECPRCGSGSTQARGIHRSVTQVYQRFQCQDCGGWFRLRKAQKNLTSNRIL